ncbi:MAG: microviridin/marinostatin family tricyclic proteinase inhibitor [Polyangia bacterium]
MSKKLTEEMSAQGAAVPFFAHLLSTQSDPQAETGPAPTYHCLDSPCTKKYPSDDDEATTWFGDRD